MDVVVDVVVFSSSSMHGIRPDQGAGQGMESRFPTSTLASVRPGTSLHALIRAMAPAMEHTVRVVEGAQWAARCKYGPFSPPPRSTVHLRVQLGRWMLCIASTSPRFILFFARGDGSVGAFSCLLVPRVMCDCLFDLPLPSPQHCSASSEPL